MNIARSFRLAALVAAVLMVTADRSQAGFVGLPTTLNNLLPLGNYTTVGSLTFTFDSYAATSQGGVPLASSSIEVTALSGNSNAPVSPYGFQLNGPLGAVPNSANDIALAYSVTSATAITSVNLFSNGSMTGSGTTNVAESVFTLAANGGAGTYLGQISVNGSGTATLNLAGYTALYITKNIQYDLGESGNATLSFIDQTFTQVVPEPSSVLMLGLGLAGFTMAARRRFRKNVAV